MSVHEDNEFRLDKARARASFTRAAASYDQVAVLQREIGARMLDRLEYIKVVPERVLDVGAGTGETTEGLLRRYRQARIFALDIAPTMLWRAARRGRWWRRPACVAGDAEALPVADASMDIVFSNLTLQWCNDLDRVFGEFRRVLRPGGLVMFSTFGPGTLAELRAAWSQVDGYNHVNAFMDMHDIGDALVRARFADPVMDVERLTVTYRELRDLMTDIKRLGAHNATAGRPRGLTGRGRYRALIDAYEEYRTDGVLPASYEVVHGHAWVPAETERPSEPGVATVPVDSLRKRRRK